MFGTKLSYFTCLYRLILACIIKQFLGLLLILFTFVGNKINQVNVVKRSKDEREKHGNLQGKKNDGHRGANNANGRPSLQSRAGDGNGC
mgnify:CR=1 FL=1